MSRPAVFRVAAGWSVFLASASPRRRELLSSLGVEFQLMVPDANVESPPLPEETPADYAKRMALAKAFSVVMPSGSCAVLAADTIVYAHGAILGKPANTAQALEMLECLNGVRHEVHTGVVIRLSGKHIAFWEASEVLFGKWPAAVLAAYAASGEPLDKAGAYAVQGAGAFLVERVCGSFTNVIGLPLEKTAAALLAEGIIEPARALREY